MLEKSSCQSAYETCIAADLRSNLSTENAKNDLVARRGSRCYFVSTPAISTLLRHIPLSAPPTRLEVPVPQRLARESPSL